jgi:hypothetical protein
MICPWIGPHSSGISYTTCSGNEHERRERSRTPSSSLGHILKNVLGEYLSVCPYDIYHIDDIIYKKE